MFNFKKQYRLVSRCPRCGSIKTGYFITLMNNSFGTEKVIAKRYKNGELVKIRFGFADATEPNLFCADCDAEWYGKIINTRLDKSAISKQAKSRGITEELYKNMLDHKKIQKQKKAEAKREEKREKRERKKKWKKKNL